MKEERNVLDELLGTTEEDDLDIGDLSSNDKRTIFVFLMQFLFLFHLFACF